MAKGLEPLTRVSGAAGFTVHSTSFSSFNLAVAYADGLGGGTVLVDGDSIVTADIVVPVTVSVQGTGRGLLTGAFTVTFLGPFDCPARPFFDCTADFTGSQIVQYILPEWWGASPSASAAVNTPALQAAIIGACGNTRTNPSGLWIYNRILKFLGMYDINDKLDVFHMIGFRWEGQNKFNSGINQTATNKQIINGESVAYGEFCDLRFTTNVSQDTALIDLDYSGAEGSDLRPQNVRFYDCSFAGNGLGFIGVRIAKSGGGAQGDNVGFYRCYASGFNEAAAQLGFSTGVFAQNAIHVEWVGGDIQGCPKYGLASYGGSWIVKHPLFENGNITFADGIVQTGYDLYQEGGGTSYVENVRSESLRFAYGNWAIKDCTITGPNTTYTLPWTDLPGTTAFTNQVVTGTHVGGDGKVYIVQPEPPVVAFTDVDSPFSTSVITDNAASYVVNDLAGKYLRVRYPNCFDSGYFQIASNTATTITLASPLPFTPGDVTPAQECGLTSQYEIIDALPVFGGLQSQTATGGSATTIVKTGAGWTVNAYVGQRVSIMSGAGKYQYGVITGNTSDTIACAAGWVTDYYINGDTGLPIVITSPAAASTFVVEPDWNGGSLTSGTVELEVLEYNVVDGAIAFQGSIDGFSSDFNGILGGRLRVTAQTQIRNLRVTRADWHTSNSNVLDQTYPSGYFNNITVQRLGALEDEYIPWSITRNGAATKFTDWSWRQVGREWTIASAGEVGGGSSFLDIGWGRGDGILFSHGDAISRNIFGILGTLGRRTPHGVNQNGTDLDIQGGLATGSGIPGKINLRIGVPGASGTDPRAGIVIGFIDENGLTVPDEIYGAGWNGALTVPTKNALYDIIETLGASIGIPDGDKGDITVSGSGTAWAIDNDAVTYAKIQNVTATDKLLGRSTAGAGDIEEIPCTAAGRALIDDADATAQRTTLGLGTAGTPQFALLGLGTAAVANQGVTQEGSVDGLLIGFKVTNTNAGTSAFSQALRMVNDAGSIAAITQTGSNNTGALGGASALVVNNVANASVAFATANTLRMTITGGGNVGIGVTGFGTSAAKVLGLGNGTEPSTSPADMIQIYSVDLSAGNATLGLRTETAVVTEAVVSDRTLSIRINGVTYKLCLKS